MKCASDSAVAVKKIDHLSSFLKTENSKLIFTLALTAIQNLSSDGFILCKNLEKILILRKLIGYTKNA